MAITSQMETIDERTKEMAQYRKRPVVVDAIQWTGDNVDEIIAWADTSRVIRKLGEQLHIRTLEGIMQASLNDWIIKGVKGEVYPCKPDIFMMTYESVD